MNNINKIRAILKVILEYWNYTAGSVIMLVSLILLILGRIDKETFYVIFGAVATIGWLPNKPKPRT